MLLERAATLDTLTAAVGDANAGHGCVVLVAGEAGVGKSSLVREFTRRIGVRVLVGGCDDLITPRPLGPLRDAAAGTTLEKALADGQDPFTAVVAELATPTVLLVEDLHWADDATVDVLGYVARRIADLPAVLLLTYRDGGPLRRLLGALAGAPVHRVVLAPLSRRAVADLAAGTGWDTGLLHELTGGNPFYVTEALAAPEQDVPATVADAVLARVRQLGERCREAVEQLSVVPTLVGFELVDILLPDRAEALAEAEDRGMIEGRRGGLAFRHELARRAVEQSLPALRRRALHRAVVAALLVQPTPDLARLVHHAAAADDGATLARVAPAAGREAAAAGSHRQALAHFAAALEHADRMTPAELAGLVDDHAWELYNAGAFAAAVAGGERAVRLHRAAGEPVALGDGLVRLSRHRFMAGDTAGAVAAAEEAAQVLSPAGPVASRAFAATYHGAILALSDRPVDGAGVLAEAKELAAAAGRTDLYALCLNYESIARPDIDDDARVALLRRSLELALQHGFHEVAARGYTNLGELLFRFGRRAELERCIADGLGFTTERGFWSHSHNLEVHRCLLAMRRGSRARAETGLRMLAGRGEPTMPNFGVPLGRILARRGDPAAEALLERGWARALEQRSLLEAGYAGAALAEWAWLTERPDRAAEVMARFRSYAQRPTGVHPWAEILVYAARAGVPVEPFPGCPEPWAAMLRGEAAEHSDPYERAVELAGSENPGQLVQAVHALEDLGATAAGRIVRRRLRALGVHRVPRRRSATTRANPAGLTDRQVEVLALLTEGLTNAEIAERLVLSVRTVDSHVAAILDKLGVRTRRAASAALPHHDAEQLRRRADRA